MPVITFASPKGGVGKTTSALLLATTLIERGNDDFRVILIDGDNNTPHVNWRKRSRQEGRGNNLQIVPALSEETIMDEITQAAHQANFVIVDLEGAASALVTYAISLADFVIVPLKGSALDVDGAEKVVRLMNNQARMRGKPIPHAVLLTQTPAAVQPGNLKHVVEEIKRHAIDCFDVQLHTREPYRDLFSYNMTLSELRNALLAERDTAGAGREIRRLNDKIKSVGKAIENAETFAREVIARLEKASTWYKDQVK